jgi:hypothetical protein
MHNNAHKNGRSPLADTVPCEPGLQGEARRVEPSKSTALWLPQGRMAKDVGPSRSAGEQNIQTLYALLEFGVERRFAPARQGNRSVAQASSAAAQAEPIGALSALQHAAICGLTNRQSPSRRRLQGRRPVSLREARARSESRPGQAVTVRARSSAPLVDDADQIKTREQRGR